MIILSNRHVRFGDLQLRYLCYSGSGDRLKLQHPSVLVSASLSHVVFRDFGACTSLVNLWSKCCIYGTCRRGLPSLKRLYSKMDRYSIFSIHHPSRDFRSFSGNFLLSDILRDAHLEYVSIVTVAHHKVVGAMVFCTYSLRYFFISCDFLTGTDAGNVKSIKNAIGLSGHAIILDTFQEWP